MLQNVMDKIKDEFFKRIDQKTGWGKNEIKREYLEATHVVFNNLLDGIEVEACLKEKGS